MDSHDNEWHRFIVYAETHKEAAAYAAEQNWWLHCWDWVEADGELLVVDMRP